MYTNYIYFNIFSAPSVTLFYSLYIKVKNKNPRDTKSPVEHVRAQAGLLCTCKYSHVPNISFANGKNGFSMAFECSILYTSIGSSYVILFKFSITLLIFFPIFTLIPEREVFQISNFNCGFLYFTFNFCLLLLFLEA